jgi:SAM-dependent methyltransferase
VGEPNDAGRVFGHIYEQDHWDGGSGVGSAPDATEPYRAVLAELLPASDVSSVVDVGCGDWQLGSLVDWSAVDYLGLDVVPVVIERNRARFAKPGVRFEVRDARLQPPPSGDLLLAKDVLQHWSNADAAAFMRTNLRRYKYCLITNDVESTHWDGDVNHDVLLGEWRTMDLEKEPFGHHAVWRRDFSVRGEWVKRMTLIASPATRLAARFSAGSALSRLRASDRRSPATS